MLYSHADFYAPVFFLSEERSIIIILSQSDTGKGRHSKRCSKVQGAMTQAAIAFYLNSETKRRYRTRHGFAKLFYRGDMAMPCPYSRVGNH